MNKRSSTGSSGFAVKSINTQDKPTSSKGNASVTFSQGIVTRGKTAEKRSKPNKDDSVCTDSQERWIISTKKTKKSDLKLCFQKEEMTAHPLPVQRRKRGRPKKQCEIKKTTNTSISKKVQSKKVITRATSKREVIKRRLTFRKNQSKKKVAVNMSGGKFTTEERCSVSKKRKILKRNSVKTEEELAVENLLVDAFKETDISNCCVMVSDVMMYKKDNYMPVENDSVVTEENTSCGDVEMLLPESITYLHNQLPKSSVSIMKNIVDENNNTEYCTTTGMPNIEGSSDAATGQDPPDFFQGCISNMQTESSTEIIETDLATISLCYDDIKVTEKCIETECSKSNPETVQTSSDFGNVLVTNIIICPADMYLIEEDNTKKQHETGIDYLTLDKELNDVIGDHMIQVTDAKDFDNSVNDSILHDCENSDPKGYSYGNCESKVGPANDQESYYYENDDRNLAISQKVEMNGNEQLVDDKGDSSRRVESCFANDQESNHCENDYRNLVILRKVEVNGNEQIVDGKGDSSRRVESYFSNDQESNHCENDDRNLAISRKVGVNGNEQIVDGKGDSSRRVESYFSNDQESNHCENDDRNLAISRKVEVNGNEQIVDDKGSNDQENNHCENVGTNLVIARKVEMNGNKLLVDDKGNSSRTLDSSFANYQESNHFESDDRNLVISRRVEMNGNEKLVEGEGDSTRRVESSFDRSCYQEIDLKNNRCQVEGFEKVDLKISDDPTGIRKVSMEESGKDDIQNETLSEILMSTSKLFSLSLLQEYSSDESDDESSSETVTKNHDGGHSNDDGSNQGGDGSSHDGGGSGHTGLNSDGSGSSHDNGGSSHDNGGSSHGNGAGSYHDSGSSYHDSGDLNQDCGDCIGDIEDNRKRMELEDLNLHDKSKGDETNENDLDDLDRLSVNCDCSDLFSSDEEDITTQEIPGDAPTTSTKSHTGEKDTDTSNQKVQINVKSLSVGSLPKISNHMKSTQSIEPLVTLPNIHVSHTRRVIDIRSTRHQPAFQTFATMGFTLPASNGFRVPLGNQIPHTTFLPDYHHQFAYPGKYNPEKFVQSSPFCADPKLWQPQPLLVQTCAPVQRSCEWGFVNNLCDHYQDDFYSKRRVIISADPLQKVEDLISKGLLVQAWAEIVHYNLYQEVNINCLEHMAKNGCLMKSEGAWQMVLGILTELKRNLTYKLPALCLKLIKILCDNKDIIRAMAIYNHIPFPLNGLVPVDVFNQLLDSLMTTSQWKIARRVFGELLDTGLRPKENLLGRIVHKCYNEQDSDSIYQLLKQLQDSGMQRSHPIYQDGLQFLRRLLLSPTSYYHDDPRSSEMQLLEPQNIKELVNAIWDCPNGFHVGRLCTNFFAVWSVDAGCSPILQQELCTYLTRSPKFQTEIFADLIRVLDKERKRSPRINEACSDLLNGLLLEALALDDKVLAIHIIFPAMESHYIPVHDKGLSCLIEFFWNAGRSSMSTARRLFNLRCDNGLFGKQAVGPFEVLMQPTLTTAEIFFIIEKLLVSHRRFYHRKTCFFHAKVMIQPAENFDKMSVYDCIDRVKNVVENIFQPPLRIVRTNLSTAVSPYDAIIIEHKSIHNWLHLNYLFRDRQR